jgi:hypothetical protein
LQWHPQPLIYICAVPVNLKVALAALIQVILLLWRRIYPKENEAGKTSRPIPPKSKCKIPAKDKVCLFCQSSIEKFH